MFEPRLRLQRQTQRRSMIKVILRGGEIFFGSFGESRSSPCVSSSAGVARKDHQGNPPQGFQPDNALSPQDALDAMTIWAAQANFEENEKGSLEPGKFADFVVLEKDIMTIPIAETFSVKVLSTYVNGEKVFER